LDKLESAGQSVPTSWEQLLPLLNERFEHRNPELAARDKLMTLRQGSMTLQQFLKEFEACYAYIPRWDEADKIHRFMYGLKPYNKAKFCVDPATHSWWTSFDQMVSYITSYMSDDMSHTDSLMQAASTYGGIASQIGGDEEAVTRQKNKGWTKKGPSGKNFHRQLAKVLNAAYGVAKGGVKKPKGRPYAAGAARSWTNASGQVIPRRDPAVTRHCHLTKPPLCLGCYQPGHQVAACTHPVATGVPAGYIAPR
jgi:hypothetical protein